MSAESDSGFVTDLRARGWALLPAPRRVELGVGTVRLDAGWKLEAPDLPADDIAVETLRQRLGDEHGVALAGKGGQAVCLSVRPGAVDTGTGDGRDEQAYRLAIAADRIEVAGNAPAGLYYGVQTLAQLLDGNGAERLVLPEAVITDWPRYELRFVHWDTKHHQDRMETLQRFCDWMGRFKLNAVSFELEDKFEYPSHPVIGAPGAFTAAQMQELVDYGLRRHIQIVPNVQAPAHLGYALKHEQFAHLRCDGSNYMACMDNPEARQLIFDMYDDLCQATRGVQYFHVSTDEVYYAGICEKYRQPYNPVNRSLTWVDYTKAAHEFLAARGRRILIWAEYPLLTEHVEMLPPDIIDGILSPTKDPAFVRAEAARGLAQLAYSPMQGAEKLFPNHFGYTDAAGRRDPGRLVQAFQITLRPHADAGSVVGTFAAAWDDAGLHNETFWLGWAVMAQGGWTPGAAALEQTVAEFMDIYYGRRAADMVEVYRDMQDQARFWERAWDRRASKVRGPAYGSSHGKRPITRTDLTLLPPGMPETPGLAFQPLFRARYAELLAEVPGRLDQNDRLLGRLHANIARAERNRYNLEVFASLAYFVRSFLHLLLAVAEAEALLVRAAEAEGQQNPAQAVGLMVAARKAVGDALEGVRTTFRRMEAVWEKSRRPKNAPAGGRQFVHVMDDVKDHFADRRVDLSYHIAPIESIALEAWCEALDETTRSYAEAHDLAVQGPEEQRLED